VSTGVYGANLVVSLALRERHTNTGGEWGKEKGKKTAHKSPQLEGKNQLHDTIVSNKLGAGRGGLQIGEVQRGKA